MMVPARGTYLIEWSGCPEEGVVANLYSNDEVTESIGDDLAQRMRRFTAVPPEYSASGVWIRATESRMTPWGLEPMYQKVKP